MPLYTNRDNVKSQLLGKVRFVDDDENPNAVGPRLLNLFIDQAEAQVELDLSKRYIAPFQCEDGRAYKFLPVRPTKQVIGNMCEWMSIMRILESDFGRGSAIAGDKYYENTEKRYKAQLEVLIGERSDTNAYKFPPLPSLRFNWHNLHADDGYLGAVLNTSRYQDELYATGQINDPGATFWNGGLNGLDD